MARIPSSLSVITLLSLYCVIPANAQERGMGSITAAELKTHLSFIASDEFGGRNTPSTELKITSRYLATMVESYGFESLMPDGSFFQNIPLEITSLDESHTSLKLLIGQEEKVFKFPDDFSLRTRTDGTLSGEIAFVGYGVEAPDLGWDDYGERDLEGKIVVMLDGRLPADHPLSQTENRRYIRRRTGNALQRGVVAVITVINEERELSYRESDYSFDNPERVRLAPDEGSQQQAAGGSQIGLFLQMEIRHAAAAGLLGISGEELTDMFAALGRGEQVPGRQLSGRMVEVTVKQKMREDYTSNVVAVLEGSDPVLKQEYVLYGSHHDHVGVRNGRIYNGADDNGSGTVAMLEMAQAFSIERPKRSVIMVWHTGEEKGLWGSEYFVQNSPVPVEKMSAELNLDMICRNDPDSLYLVGSDKLSTELDAAVNRMNDRYINLNFDYVYNDLTHPELFFFRSDHYPYVQYGIPALWFFCGTTEDYHQETDTIDRVDYGKMERVTRLAYLVGYEIGNLPEMLKLDAHPDITSRGPHNLQVRWR